jgi:hypothetical protein
VVRFDAAVIELQRHDWTSLGAPHGDTGAGVRETFLKLLRAVDVSEAVGWSLEYKVEVQSMTFEVALPSISVILAAFTREFPRFVEAKFLNVLEAIITGQPHRSEIEMGNIELVDRCLVVSKGWDPGPLWTVREMERGDDIERTRLCRYRSRSVRRVRCQVWIPKWSPGRDRCTVTCRQ